MALANSLISGSVASQSMVAIFAGAYLAPAGAGILAIHATASAGHAASKDLLSADLMSRARLLLQAKRADAALALLTPIEADLAGQPDFDFLIGLCYLDTNQPTRAVFAFERVLARQPDNAQAKAELARAHILLGETETAAHLIRSAATDETVPAEARRTLWALYQDLGQPDGTRADRAMGNLGQWRLGGRLGLSGGYDSNVSAATSLTSLELPSLELSGLGAIGSSTLSDSARARSAASALLSANANAVVPVSSALALVGGLGFDRHANQNASAYDLISADSHLGMVATNGPQTISVRFAAQNAWLGQRRIRQALGGTGDLQVPLSAQWSVSPYIQVFHLTYPREAERAAWRSLFGAATIHSFQWFGRDGSVFGGLYAGQEQAGVGYQPYGHQFQGLRLGAEYKFGTKITGSLQAELEQRRYGGLEPLFLRKRYDHEVDAKGALVYDLGEQWSTNVELSWTRVKSTIGLYDYSRKAVFTGIAKAF